MKVADEVVELPAPKFKDGKVGITCETEGASIGYRLFNENKLPSGPWEVYNDPFSIKGFKKLQIQAHRIGYVPSESIITELN